MDHPIKRDHARFKRIVRGALRQNLKKYVNQGNIVVPKGKGQFSVPMPSIEFPQFRFGDNQNDGVGQGEGQPGDAPPGKEEPGQGESGEGEGKKELEVDFSLEELATILGEELELPFIEPKGKKQIEAEVTHYNDIGTQGPDSLRHLKRTYKEALKRQISSGNYDATNPTIIPVRRDYRYRAAKTHQEFENAAVVIYMMDVSGSMGDEQKEIVRTESFWINLWLKHQYKDIDVRYIIHDATAKEVEEDVFFRTRESGGTLISSAYKLCHDIISSDYHSDEWNIYPFHFSDGDNWSSDDTKLCMEILREKIFPASNVFCYGQVESRYGSGQFYKDLTQEFSDANDHLILSQIKGRDDILRSIKDFLGKGR